MMLLYTAYASENFGDMFKAKVIPKSLNQPESKTEIHRIKKCQQLSLHQTKQFAAFPEKTPEKGFFPHPLWAHQSHGEGECGQNRSIAVYKSINQMKHFETHFFRPACTVVKTGVSLKAFNFCE
ncbi:MAG: hypothetical protein RMJ03_03930 [Nitrososphaerota archaeon]|nr:hypothetical protein [Nitrososphaerota archaeon]